MRPAYKVAVCGLFVAAVTALAFWAGENPAQEMAMHREHITPAMAKQGAPRERLPIAWHIADEFQSFDEPLGQPQGDDGHQTHTGGDATENCFVVLPKEAAKLVKLATVAIGNYPEKGDSFMGICKVIEP